jgi:hypothetical protein
MYLPYMVLCRLISVLIALTVCLSKTNTRYFINYVVDLYLEVKINMRLNGVEDFKIQTTQAKVIIDI